LNVIPVSAYEQYSSIRSLDHSFCAMQVPFIVTQLLVSVGDEESSSVGFSVDEYVLGAAVGNGVGRYVHTNEIAFFASSHSGCSGIQVGAAVGSAQRVFSM